MDVSKARDFLFKSKPGILCLIAVVAVILLLTFSDFRTSLSNRMEEEGITLPELVKGAPVESVSRSSPGGLPEVVPSPTPKQIQAKESQSRNGTFSQDVNAGEGNSSQPSTSLPPVAVRRNTRIGLRQQPIPQVAPSASPTPITNQRQIRNYSERFAPYGRAIQCRLVFTVDSSRVETPVVGLVTEDIWWNGNLIIPAGSEVHGTAQTDREKGRIRAEGKWVVVLPEFSEIINGTEIVLTGAALARQEEDAEGQKSWGVQDGSFGLLGKTIRTDNWAEIKLFAAAFLNAAAQALGNTSMIIAPAFGKATGTGSAMSGISPIINAPMSGATAGTTSVLGEFAKQIQQEITDNGFYTRVQSGTQFYLYVRQTIDISDARVGDSAAIAREQEDRRQTLEKQRRADTIRANQTPGMMDPSALDAVAQSVNQIRSTQDPNAPQQPPVVRRATPIALPQQQQDLTTQPTQ